MEIGSKVVHENLGEGTIKSVHDGKVVVDFGDFDVEFDAEGQKHLSAE